MHPGRIADLPVPASVKHAVASFVERLRQAAGGKVRQIVVYGSAARGEYGPDSDIDLLVYWDGAESEARDILAAISTDILVAHRVVINAFPVDGPHEDRMAALDTRFHKAVQAEGLIVSE